MIRVHRLATPFIALALCLAGSPSASGAAAQASKPTPAKKSAAPRSMPDSVLARVGPTRTVTVSEFRKAWGQLQPPARPDSLTPEGARQFLDLLVEKEVLAERAMQEKWVWSALDSAQYFSLRDQLMVKMALDSALAEGRRQPGADTLSLPQLGVAVRESTVAKMAVRFDDQVVERMRAALQALPRPSRDSSLFAQLKVLGALPKVELSDSALVMATSTEGPYLVRDLLLSWRSVNPLSRPRIETAEQVHDLVRNGLFERRLRADAERKHLDRHPAIASELQQRREFIAVSRFVDREVYDKLSPDSVELRRFFDQHAEEYRLPDRAQLIRIVSPTRADAGRMGARLLNAAEAETLAARARRERLNYKVEISARSDSALFAAAWKAGPGTVVGPDSARGGWVVARVTELHPSRLRTFEEVRDGVEQHYVNLEGERRMRELIDKLRKQTSVAVNSPAVTKLGHSG